MLPILSHSSIMIFYPTDTYNSRLGFGLNLSVSVEMQLPNDRYVAKSLEIIFWLFFFPYRGLFLCFAKMLGFSSLPPHAATGNRIHVVLLPPLWGTLIQPILKRKTRCEFFLLIAEFEQRTMWCKARIILIK